MPSAIFRASGLLLAADVPLSLLSGAALLWLLDLQSSPRLDILIALWLGGYALKLAVLLAIAAVAARRQKTASASNEEPESPPKTSLAIRRPAVTASIAFALASGAIYPAIAFVLVHWAPGNLWLTPRALVAMAPFSAAIVLAAWAFSYVFLLRKLAQFHRHAEAPDRSAPAAGPVFIAFALAAAPACWMLALTYMNEVKAAFSAGALESRITALALVADMQGHEEESLVQAEDITLQRSTDRHYAFLLEDGRMLAGIPASSIFLANPDLMRLVSALARENKEALLEHPRQELAIALIPIDESLTAGAVTVMPASLPAHTNFVLFLYFLPALLWGAWMAAMLHAGARPQTF